MTAHRFALKLREQGHEVRIVTNDMIGQDIYTLKTNYIPIVSRVAAKQNISFAKADKKIIKQALEGADVVHALMPFKASRVAIKIAKKMGIPTTSAFHVQPENIVYGAGLKKFSSFFSKIIYKKFKRFFKKTQHVHCPSNFIAQELKKNKYPNQFHVISNGIDDSFIYKEKSIVSDKYELLMIGRFAPEKRQDIILKAISLSKYKDRIHLTLAGSGPTKNKLEKLAKKLNIDVTFGFYSKEDLIKTIQNQDLYIHAADVEIEAISCIEAIACGKVPVIADSKKSATPQFALDERSLFKQRNPKDLKDKIEYWLENEEERKNMEVLYALSSKKYTLTESVTKFESMLESAIFDHKSNKLAKTKLGKRIKKTVTKGKVFKLCILIFYYTVFPILMLYNKFCLKTKIKNKRNLKKVKGGAVLISNHVHTLDSVMSGLVAFPRKVLFTGMKYNLTRPIIGPIVRLFGTVPTPQSILENRIFFNEISKKARQGKYVHFFPEGELVKKDEKLREFKRGAFKVAVDSSVPIIPIRINFQDKKALFGNKIKKQITLNVGKPMFPDYSLNAKEALEKLKLESEEAMNDLI